MQHFVDTNIFLRVLVADQKKQFIESKRFLNKVKENKIIACTSSIVLAEIVWTLTSYYKFPKEKVIQAVRSIVNLRGMKIIDNFNHLLALELYEKYSVKYIDALIASIKEIAAKEMIVISYDKDFAKLPILSQNPSFTN